MSIYLEHLLSALLQLIDLQISKMSTQLEQSENSLNVSIFLALLAKTSRFS